MRTYASSRVKRKSFCRKKWSPDVFIDSRRPYLYTKTVHKYGVSIQSSKMVREMSRQITQKLWTTWTWDLDKLFIHQSFVTFHFLGFFHRTVDNLLFCAVFIAWQWKRLEPGRAFKLSCSWKLLSFSPTRQTAPRSPRMAYGCFLVFWKILLVALSSIKRFYDESPFGVFLHLLMALPGFKYYKSL